MYLEDFYKGYYKFYEFDETFKELAKQSNVAKLYSLGYEFFMCNPEERGEYFHPSGVCGCLEGLPSSKFYVSSYELYWMEGSHEEYYIEDQNGNPICNCLYVFGNYKGQFHSGLIVFCSKESKEGDRTLYNDWYERPIDAEGTIIKPILTRSSKQNDYIFSSTQERELYVTFDFNELRYVIVNSNNGDVIDDANGYGYRTRIKAFNAFNYKKANNLL